MPTNALNPIVETRAFATVNQLASQTCSAGQAFQFVTSNALAANMTVQQTSIKVLKDGNYSIFVATPCLNSSHTVAVSKNSVPLISPISGNGCARIIAQCASGDLLQLFNVGPGSVTLGAGGGDVYIEIVRVV